MTKERMYAITPSCGHQKGGEKGVKWEKWCVCNGHGLCAGDSTAEQRSRMLR